MRPLPAALLVAAIISCALAAADNDAVASSTVTVNTTDVTDDGTCDSTHCSIYEAIDRPEAVAVEPSGLTSPKVGPWLQSAGRNLGRYAPDHVIAFSDAVLDGTTQTTNRGDANPLGPEA